jgi:hypothetical protein
LTIKELQTLVEQLAAHSNVLAEQQSTINKLVTEGLTQLSLDTKALLLIVQSHERRLNGGGEGT